jgi:hypothetical protein
MEEHRNVVEETLYDQEESNENKFENKKSECEKNVDENDEEDTIAVN